MKVVFVVPRYGLEVTGGAERLCRDVAEHMKKHWEVEVVTTCARDYMTWKDEYAPGTEMINGVTVHRFPVDAPRDVAAFDRLSEALYHGARGREQERAWMRAQGPCSTALLAFLRERREAYDWFFYVPYLYATTYDGLPLTPRRAVLIPAAHDEPPITLGIFQEVFEAARALVFSTPEEQALVNARFDVGRTPQAVIGVGLDRRAPGDGTRFRRTHAARIGDRPLLLYAGRIDPSKGCDHLFDYFARYRAERPRPDLALVLLGSAAMPVPASPDVVYLGFVSEEEKQDAMAAAELVVLPSPYESLSIVALEAWRAARPVLANGVSDVLRGQCLRSNAGLWYTSYAEFREALGLLLERPDVARALGRAGQAFVAARYEWSVIEAQYCRFLAGLAPDG